MAYQTYDAATNHEDLTDVLVKLGQMKTPVFSSLKKVSASNTLHETSTYSQDAAATNAQVEGASYSYSALTAPARVTNYTQIFRKTFQVSNTQQAVNPAGMADEYAFRVQVALESIGRDIEKALVNGTANSGASGTGRRLKGILASITTEISTGTGTGRALKATEINSALQGVYENGGEPDWMLCPFGQLNKIAALADADRVYNDGNTTITQNVMVYQSPFGQLSVQGDSQMPTTQIALLQKDMWAVAQLRPVKKTDTPETADAKNGVVQGELTLEAKAESFNGKMTGLVA